MKKLLFLVLAVPALMQAKNGCPFPVKKLGSKTEMPKKITTPAAAAPAVEPETTMIGKETKPTTVVEEPMLMPETPMTPMPGEGPIGEEPEMGKEAPMMPQPTTPTSAVREMSTTPATTGGVTTMPKQPVAPATTAAEDIFKF